MRIVDTLKGFAYPQFVTQSLLGYLDAESVEEQIKFLELERSKEEMTELISKISEVFCEENFPFRSLHRDNFEALNEFLFYKEALEFVEKSGEYAYNMDHLIKSGEDFSSAFDTVQDGIMEKWFWHCNALGLITEEALQVLSECMESEQ